MTTNKPEFPVAADQVTSDDPRPQRARQEQPTGHYRDDAALPFYDRHPEWRPRHLSRRLARRLARRRAIRERL
jgi:hypothetical protein